MRGAARALGWELWRQHRWVFTALAAAFALVCAAKLLVLGPAYPIRLDPPNGTAAFVIVPVTVTWFVFVGAFSYGFAGDLTARQSMYPARLLVLPVKTRALAGWPMLYGVAASAALWLMTVLMLRATGTATPIPLVWPALLMSGYLAWTQACMWMPYGVRGLRVGVAVLWLAAIDAVVLVALHVHASDLRMIEILAPQIPLAYLAACAAVARARRGDVPDWTRVFAGSGRTREAARFASALRAQIWFEARRQRSLAAMTAIVVPVELLLLFVPGDGTAPVVLLTLVMVLATPPLLAVFASTSVRPPGPFVAGRPMTTGALVGARLAAALAATAAAWLVAIVAALLALWLSGAGPIAIERARSAAAVFGTPRAVVLALLIVGAAVASTWKQLVQGLCIGASGRAWVVKGTVVLALACVAAAGPLLQWIAGTPRVRGAIWDTVPLVLAVAAALKISTAAWVVVRLYHRRVIADRVLVAGAACWSAAVLSLYAVLAWFVSSPIVPHHVLMLVAIVGVPFVRPALAPLALAWSRHR